MTRLNMFEILKQKYNITEELQNISRLFQTELFAGYYDEHYNITTVVQNEFVRWSGRGSCIDCKHMEKRLGVDKIIANSKNADKKDIVLCLEYYLNIIRLYENTKYKHGYYSPLLTYSILNENIKILLDYINYQEYYIEKEKRIILVQKDPTVMMVAEQSSQDTGLSILMYNHASLEGDLEGKREILRKIAIEYEPLLKKPIDGFTTYFDRVKDMLNNFNIRHNNQEGDNKKELIVKLTNKEIEKWYDELYKLLLFCILIKDNFDRKKRIEDFLKVLNKKN